ncbi:MAG TPA: YfiR family protein [Thermodesulfobacteriota bacterium]|nr:YfiR family protein [Thermodesulfobacteriota bacterium]
MKIKKHRTVWGLLPFLILLCSVLPAAGDEIQEEQVKVAFLYNFAKFVEWPPEAFKTDSATLTIGLIGPDPFGSLLDSLKEKTIKGRKINIKRMAKAENPEDCHIWFISASEKSNLRNILAQAKNHNILTVSDMDRFAQQGGMIGLINQEGRINFEINIDAVQRSKLRFSAQLLKLAKIVHGGI